MLLIELSDMIGAIRGIGLKNKLFSLEDILELVYFTNTNDNEFGTLNSIKEHIEQLETLCINKQESLYKMKLANIIKNIEIILRNDFNNGVTINDLVQFSILRSEVAIEEEKEGRYKK